MKKITSLLVFVLALSMLSCTKDGPTTINEITDHYTAPTGATVMNLTKAESTWSLDRRYFKLDFGNDLVTTLVGYDALLAPGEYVLGADAIGNAIDTKVKGAAAQSGYVLVTKKDNQYQITGTFGDQVLFWEGSLDFTPDPDPTHLSEVMSAQSNLASGVQSVTMNLATPGISKGYNESWQEVWTGEGGYLALDLYSDDGYLHDGVYTASAQGGAIEPGQFGIGWDPGDLYGIGWVFENWGTCWWEVKDGAATATKITDGLVTVTSREEKVEDKDVTIWTIFWGSEYPQELVFEGAIPALTKPKQNGPVQLDYLYTEDDLQPVTDQSGAVVSGVMKHPIHITDKNGTEVAYLELLMAEGETDYSGSYPSTSYASQAGQMADGWEFDASAWGMGIMSGGSYYMDGGTKVLLYAGQYTVDVTKIATGAYRFTCSLFDLSAAGPDYVPGGDDVGDALPAKDVVTEHASGVDKHTITIGEGDNIVAVFELLTATGADFVGSFVSTEYAAEPGMLCNGYSFPDWGIFGGSYIMVDGVRQDVAPGETVEVTNVSGNVYKFVGSAGFTYVADVAK